MSQRSLIIRAGSGATIDRGNGVVTTPYFGSWGLDDNRITTGLAVFQPGREMPLHTHNVEESVLVVEGAAIVFIDGISHEIAPGDATWVAAGVPHRYANFGDVPMRMYWTFGGRLVTRTILETGETFVHLSAEEVGAFEAQPNSPGPA